jgi:hydroxyacylglutathione hydrolase
MAQQQPDILARGVRWFDDWFAIEELAPGAFAIGEPLYQHINWNYLIEGRDRALLFDTGPGLRSIAAAVTSLTSKPVTALPSHLHFDHTGNLHEFPQIAMPDLPELRACESDGMFHATEELFLGSYESMIWKPVWVGQWWPIGQRIDLGGTQLDLLHTPGHSPDSVSLWNAQANMLFAADFIYPGELYGQVPGSNLQEYLASAERLLETLSEQTRIFCAHGKPDACGKHRAPRMDRNDISDLRHALVTLKASGRHPASTVINAKMTLTANEAAFASWQAR